jgi:hypothetical protein
MEIKTWRTGRFVLFAIVLLVATPLPWCAGDGGRVGMLTRPGFAGREIVRLTIADESRQ